MIPNFLFPTYFKIIGLIAFLLALAGHLIYGYFYFLLFTAVAFFGLFLIASSREKIEDEMIQDIRLKSLQTAVFLQVVFILGFTLIDNWRGEGFVNLPIPAVLVGILFIAVYLEVFYYQLYFKQDEE
ncbi:hypothetical protein [Belliella pelovolcani]|uniref:hypothetical protein n=1 Tax=Belliella pelovolcani TaxID=529505 RepID=UPI00391A7314